jgi:hypothetical protein
MLTTMGILGLLLAIAGTVVTLRNGLPLDEAPVAPLAPAALTSASPGALAEGPAPTPVAVATPQQPTGEALTQVTPTPPPSFHPAPAQPRPAIAQATPPPSAAVAPAVAAPQGPVEADSLPVVAGPRE